MQLTGNPVVFSIFCLYDTDINYLQQKVEFVMFRIKGERKTMEIALKIIDLILKVLVITTIVDIFLLGLLRPKFSRKADYSKFFVSPRSETVKTEAGSYFEFQNGGGCAGFSSAFVLRYLGEAANGVDTFKEVPYQMKGGAGVPKGISGFFKKRGIKMTACTGNFAALKNEIAKGNPVIVVIRSFVGKNDLHFACITGYDEENIYFADSIKDWVNVEDNGVYYNRVVPVSEFKKLWNTSMLKMPLYRNIFFVMN